MSGKTKKAPRTQTPRRSSGSGPGRPLEPKTAEMNGNERIQKISGLTFRQQSALPSVVVAPSIAEAARNTGVAESTLRRWLEDPAFRNELDLARKEAYDLALKQLQALIPECLAIFADVAANSPDPALRLRAARYLITYGVKLHEVDGLNERVRNLQQAVETSKESG